MIYLEVNSRQYENFTSIECNVAMDNISGVFSFEATSAKKIAFPIKAGDKCRVLIDDEPIITGFIDIIEITRGANSHLVNIVGRDKTSDAIDATIGALDEFNAPISLTDVIKKTLANADISDIDVINLVPDLQPFAAGELISGEIGNKVFSFLENHARKKQVVLSSDGDGNIVITRASKTLIASALVSVDGNQFNNVTSSSAKVDFSQRYHKYVVHSQANPVANLGGQPNISASVSIKGEAIDDEVRNSRILNIKAEQPTDLAGAKLRAEWEKNIRRARSIRYSCSVQGHRAPVSKVPWRPNLLVKVLDDSVDINADMLINAVTYQFSNEGGSTSTLALIDKNAYTLENDPPRTEQQSNKLAPEFKTERLNQ
jgi:prophage tail gpP-like protein